MTSYEERKQKLKEKYHNDPVFREKQKANSRRWRQENPARMREHRKTWEHSNPAWIMYHNAKRRAKDLNIPFDISFKDIYIPDYCPVFGFKLSQETRETAPSLDRIVPALGYTKENICVISMRANRLKGDASIDELKKLVAYLEHQE